MGIVPKYMFNLVTWLAAPPPDNRINQNHGISKSPETGWLFRKISPLDFLRHFRTNYGNYGGEPTEARGGWDGFPRNERHGCRPTPPEDPSEPDLARGAEYLSAFLHDRLFRGCERAFRPFHCGVVTTYALENRAAGEGDNRDHSLFAIRAARCSIHETSPDFPPQLGTRTFVPFGRSATSAPRQRAPKSRAREVRTLRGVFSRNRLTHIGGQLAIVQSQPRI
jgi:hypothetical protein